MPSPESLSIWPPTEMPPKGTSRSFCPTPSFADFSADGVFAAPTLAAKEASNGLPVDLGVLAEPKDANAPEPRPNALDAPAVGEARLPPGVVIELKGFVFPCDELSPPNRLGNDALRPAEGSPWPLELGVERESLPELLLFPTLAAARSSPELGSPSNSPRLLSGEPDAR